MAVERDGRPVLLHTQRNNDVADFLLRRGLVPGLEDAAVVVREVPSGHSRFDFLLRQNGIERLLEVKSCTLFGNGVAMFPDAVTVRGARHLESLARIARRDDAVPAVLFLVHTDCVDWFMPDYHTDLHFARTLLRVRHGVEVIALSLAWQSDLTLAGPPRRLCIPWGRVGEEAADRGSYLLVLEVSRPVRTEIGRMGRCEIAAGFYIYVGSAMRALSRRINRHQRRRKRFHWHIDYLRECAARVTPLPIRASARLECPLAHALSELFPSPIGGFGSSDCDCDSHLFFSDKDPMNSAAFHHLLQSFRMRHPRSE